MLKPILVTKTIISLVTTVLSSPVLCMFRKESGTIQIM
jgi:hypothetical protein